MKYIKSFVWGLAVISEITLFLILSLYLYSHRIVSNGFIYERLGELIINANNGSDILQGFYTFPLVSPFLLIISTLTGLELVNVIYLPIVQIIGFCSLVIFSKLFFDPKHCIIIFTAVFLYVFALIYNFEEYTIAEGIFFFFLYSFYVTLTREKNRNIFAAISIFLYLAIKSYGPPVEAWALCFIGSFTLFILITQKLNKKDYFKFKNNPPVNLLVLLTVIFFAYNPKFYDQLLYREAGSTLFMDTISSVINSLLYNSKVTPEYEYILNTPAPLRITDTLYHVVILLGFGVIISNSVLKKNLLSEFRDMESLFFLALIIPFAADFGIYASIGLFTTRYLIVVYPFISAYFLKKRSQKLFSVITIVFLILGFAHCLLLVHYDLGYKLSSEDSSSSLTSYLGSNTEESSYILTDHRTYGLLRTYFAILFNDPYYFIFREYNSERYKSIFGLSKTQLLDFDYLVVSIKNLDYPIQVGAPLWVYYEPIHERYSLLNNDGLNKIYQSQDFEIYKP